MITKIYEIRCADCGFKEQDHLARFNTNAVKKFRSRGWRINRDRDTSKCPECSKDYGKNGQRKRKVAL